MKNPDIFTLFPVPLFKANFGSTEEELKLIKTLAYEYQPNNGNQRSKNSYLLALKGMEKLSVFIAAQLKMYAQQILATPETLLVTQSWANRNPQGSTHHEHIHPNSIVSGVLYLDKSNNLPPIQFSRDQFMPIRLKSTKMNYFNSTSFLMRPEEGNLILFPSTLRHSVPINTEENTRHSISFNTFAKTLGEEEKLDSVHIAQL